MTTLFISDLHLDESRPDLCEAFSGFCHHRARAAQQLYVLGDLVDAWLGDDDDGTVAALVRLELAALASAGVDVYLMRGNRDFLFGQKLARECGITLIDDPTVIELYGQNALLMHGDSLCTDDTEYMAFREKIRNPSMQQQLLDKPLNERRAIAAQLRTQSKSANASKTEDIMDVNHEAVRSALSTHHCRLLIHGHTHRPAEHTLDIDGDTASRIVLGDWDRQGWYLEVSPTLRKLVSFPIDTRP